MTLRDGYEDGDVEEGVGDEEGLVEDLHHFAADFAVGDGEGVVLRAEHRFEALSRGVAGESGLQEDDDGGDGVVVVGADVGKPTGVRPFYDRDAKIEVLTASKRLRGA